MEARFHKTETFATVECLNQYRPPAKKITNYFLFSAFFFKKNVPPGRPEPPA
jgi:hypothetical protein